MDMPLKPNFQPRAPTASTKWRVIRAEMFVDWQYRNSNRIERPGVTRTSLRQDFADANLTHLKLARIFLRKEFVITVAANGLYIPSVSNALLSGSAYLPRIRGPSRGTVLPTLNMRPITVGSPPRPAEEDRDYVPVENAEWRLEDYTYVRDSETGELLTLARFYGGWDCYRRVGDKDFVIEEYS